MPWLFCGPGAAVRRALARTALFTLLSAATGAIAGELQSSSPDVRAILAAQGFSGSLQLAGPTTESDTRLGRIGAIKTASGRYELFFHAYEWNRQAGEFIRGAYRLVVIRDGCCYVGSYRVPYGMPVVAGRRVVFDIPEGEGGAIEFTEGGPPPVVRLGGDYIALFR